MSRIGKRILNIPEKTEISVVGDVFTVKGPLGSLSRPIGHFVTVKTDGKTLSVESKRADNTAFWGTASAHIKNMIDGVNKAFEKKLIVEGIGFKADVKGTDIVLNLGFSHQIKLAIPEGLKVVSDKNNVITITGISKDLVGQFASKIKGLKKPEPYKGKGIRYEGEVIRRKEGKKSA